MVVEQVMQQGLPFTIEPIPLKRKVLWSRFAGHAATQADMWIVRTVYYAFWWEVRVQDVFQRVFEWNQNLREQADAGSLVMWLDLLVAEHVTLLDTYREIAVQVAAGEGSYARYYQDIDERFTAVSGVLDVMRQYGVMFCSQWGLAVPERFLLESVSPTVSE